MDCSIDIIPKTYSFILPSQFGQINNHSDKSDSQEDIIYSITKNSTLMSIIKDDKFHPKACIKFFDKSMFIYNLINKNKLLIIDIVFLFFSVNKFKVWGCIFRKDIESMCSHTDHNYSCQSCINADGCNL